MRKSFDRYFREGIKYILGAENNDIAKQELPITDSYYKSCGDQVYNYALDMTNKEIYQAVEGMYHNLKI